MKSYSSFTCRVVIVVFLVEAIALGAAFTTFISCRRQLFSEKTLFSSFLTLRSRPSDTRISGFRSSRTTPMAHSSSSTPARDISSLQQWAAGNGVQFHDNVGLVSSSSTANDTPTIDNDAEDDWGVSVMMPSATGRSTTTSMNAGTIVLSVPTSLVLSSTRVAQELVNEYKLDLQESTDILENCGFANQTPEFFLFVKILVETTKGKESLWHPWLESLPQTFQTGVYMNSFEKSCLPPFAYALADFETKKLKAFRQALTTLLEQAVAAETLPFLKEAISKQQQDNSDDDLLKWAYNVVFSRCWKYADQVDDSAAHDTIRSDIVPLGDMFNHADPTNVVVNYVDDNQDKNDTTGSNTAVKFLLNQDVEMKQGEKDPQLCLSYGLTTNPYRFLILFGFANDQMKELYCQVLFSKPSKEMIDLGCADRSKMVYRTEDGAIAHTVWDCVLYSLLEQQVGNAQVEAVRKAFYQAHLAGDDETKAAIRQNYLLESCLTLRNHVDRTLKEFDELVIKVDSIIEASGDVSLAEKEYPHLGMIHKHNKFIQGVFEKVKQRLERMIQTETTRRRQAMAETTQQQ